MFGGSRATVMGQYVLDPWIFKLAGVPQELWSIQAYVSDLLVLRLTSGVTLEKVNFVENISLGSKAVLSTTLYFTRLRLFGVNVKVLGFKECVMYSWATMIWLTSFLKPLGKDNSLANKQNMVAETLAVIFSVSRGGDTPNPRHLISEPA
eukprot:scaffold54306_cov38-Attheya_sp.AAC.2